MCTHAHMHVHMHKHSRETATELVISCAASVLIDSYTFVTANDVNAHPDSEPFTCLRICRDCMLLHVDTPIYQNVCATVGSMPMHISKCMSNKTSEHLKEQ